MTKITEWKLAKFTFFDKETRTGNKNIWDAMRR